MLASRAFSSIVRHHWGSASALRTEVRTGGDDVGELQAIHELGDPSNMTGDHRVGATGVMSHNNGVVDQQPARECSDAGPDVVASTPGRLGVA
jgi:hypothetical protein